MHLITRVDAASRLSPAGINEHFRKYYLPPAWTPWCPHKEEALNWGAGPLSKGRVISESSREEWERLWKHRTNLLWQFLQQQKLLEHPEGGNAGANTAQLHAVVPAAASGANWIRGSLSSPSDAHPQSGEHSGSPALLRWQQG